MVKRRVLACCLLSMLLSACDGKTPAGISTDLFSFRLISADDSPFEFSSLKDNSASVFVFLAPDCPLSQNYTLTLNALQARFNEASVGFYGVIAGVHYSREEVDNFVRTYKIGFPVLLDKDLRLADFFTANTTPEAFAVNPHGETIYRGAIDNWAVDLGQHRRVITEHYLMDALNGFINGGEVHAMETKAVGCFIERNL